VFADSFLLPPHDVPSTPAHGARRFLLLLALGGPLPPLLYHAVTFTPPSRRTEDPEAARPRGVRVCAVLRDG